VHTWMPAQADKLMTENMSKNLIDQDEYPMTRAFPLIVINTFNNACLVRNSSHSL
jgi:glutamate/tyrosine decarboxylase-like PLP-dependent enzyme